jgi:hypothetical protein
MSKFPAMRTTLTLLASLLVLALLPALASGHAERATYFPDASKGERPTHRTGGPSRVVCKKNSAQLVKRSWKGKTGFPKRRRAYLLRVLKRCKYRNIQGAVNAAKSGERILIMPGVYREEPSRKIPVADPKCAGEGYWEASGDNHTVDGRVPTYKHQVDCPNARNLIAVIGDSLADDDRECDQKCNLQMQGLGRRSRDVLIEGDRYKQDVIRADRADGFQIENVTVEQGGYNDVNIVETNGFRLDHIVARYANHYGILTFTSDHGLYEHIDAYGNGDSGVYPGSGPEGHCQRYGIEVRFVNSHDNVLGSSGTAGNGTWYHHNKMHDNNAGVALDSFAPGHPGMPQDCSKWTDNEIYSNNKNFFDSERDAYCNEVPFEKRDKTKVCPQFIAVVGSGFMFYGANKNILENNRIYDNWRSGMRLFWVPATLRGDNDPSHQNDTSNGNRIVNNTFGVAPDGASKPNGTDVYWDEQGMGNCWEDNATAPGRPLSKDPLVLPDCKSGGSLSPVSNASKTAMDAPCVTWNPRTNTDPPGCTWFTTPPPPSQ